MERKKQKPFNNDQYFKYTNFKYRMWVKRPTTDECHGLYILLNVSRFPVYIRNPPPRQNGFTGLSDPGPVRRLFTGNHCADEICCLAGIDLPTLDKIIEDDPNVAIIWR